ncbi:MAG: agmatinase [Thermoplasmata archaeon]|jgi:agmatinase
MTDIEERVRKLQRGTVAVVGVPLDENSSFLRGAALGPESMRAALRSGSANMSTELGIDLDSAEGWIDLGDLQLTTGEDLLAQVERTVASILSAGARVLALGGDHSISYPVLRAYTKAYDDLTVLHIDAHPDTYDEYGGSRHSHACPFARIMEERPALKLVQVGIRTANSHQRDQARRFGITMIEMKDWTYSKMPKLNGPIYLSLDLDVLDPGFAPGVSHHEPGGMSTRDVIQIIHGLPNSLVGADIVELNPTRDPSGMTAMVAAKFYRELVGRMLKQG